MGGSESVLVVDDGKSGNCCLRNCASCNILRTHLLHRFILSSSHFMTVFVSLAESEEAHIEGKGTKEQRRRRLDG